MTALALGTFAAKEERIELLRRQSMRRVLYRDLSAGWDAWHELYTARRYALEKLRQCTARLKAPELNDAFTGWTEEVSKAKREAEVAEMLRREAAAQGASSALEAELAKVRAEYEARIEHMELTHKTAMERQVIELTGTADQIAALRDEKSKEERIELLRRQVRATASLPARQPDPQRQDQPYRPHRHSSPTRHITADTSARLPRIAGGPSHRERRPHARLGGVA